MKQTGKRKTRIKLLCAGLLLIVSVLPTGIANADLEYASGAGTSGDPYIITTCAQLQSITDLSVTSGVYIQLGSNINCDVTPYNTGNGFTPIMASGGFAGTLNGNGYVISGLYINDSTDHDVGLFYQTNNATIENLGILDANVTGSNGGGSVAGILIGNAAQGVVENVYATGQVTTTEYAAGLVGESNFVTVKDSYSDVSLTASLYEAGIVGYLTSGLVLNSYSVGSFDSGAEHIGGITGYTGTDTISNSYSVYPSLIAANVGGNTINDGSAGGQALSSFYQTSPLAAVYTGSPAWDFTAPWYFSDDNSLPIFESSLPPNTDNTSSAVTNTDPSSTGTAIKTPDTGYGMPNTTSSVVMALVITGTISTGVGLLLIYRSKYSATV